MVAGDVLIEFQGVFQAAHRTSRGCPGVGNPPWVIVCHITEMCSWKGRRARESTWLFVSVWTGCVGWMFTNCGANVCDIGPAVSKRVVFSRNSVGAAAFHYATQGLSCRRKTRSLSIAWRQYFMTSHSVRALHFGFEPPWKECGDKDECVRRRPHPMKKISWTDEGVIVYQNRETLHMGLQLLDKNNCI